MFNADPNTATKFLRLIQEHSRSGNCDSYKYSEDIVTNNWRQL